MIINYTVHTITHENQPWVRSKKNCNSCFGHNISKIVRSLLYKSRQHCEDVGSILFLNNKTLIELKKSYIGNANSNQPVHLNEILGL